MNVVQQYFGCHGLADAATNRLSSFKAVGETFIRSFPHENPATSFPVKLVAAFNNFVVELLQCFLHFHHSKGQVVPTNKQLANLARQHANAMLIHYLETKVYRIMGWRFPLENFRTLTWFIRVIDWLKN